MLRVRLKIGTGEGATPVYTDATYGLVYLDSDKRVGPDTKGYESTSYPEEEGEHIIPKTVDAAFDYKVKFFIQATSLKDANKRIDEFNKLLYSQSQGSSVKTYKQVTFYNDYKRHKIVGYPKEIPLADEFWQDGIPVSDPRHKNINDIVIVEWTIRVTKPSLCEYTTPFTEDQTTT